MAPGVGPKWHHNIHSMLCHRRRRRRRRRRGNSLERHRGVSFIETKHRAPNIWANSTRGLFFFVGLSHRRVAANRPSISFHYTKWTRYSHSRITHSGTMWHGAGSSTHLTLQSIESHMCVLTMHFYDQHTDPFTWPISGKNCFRSIVFFVVVFFVLMSVKALSVAYNVCFSYLHTECVHRVCWVRMEILHPFSMHVHAFGIFHAVAHFISFHSFHCRQSTHTSSSSSFFGWSLLLYALNALLYLHSICSF